MNRLIGGVLLGAVCGSAQADLVINLQSEQGDFIGQGATQTLTYTGSDIYTHLDGTNGEITVYASAAGYPFQIVLSPPRSVSGATVASGMCYERALRHQEVERPGLDVSMDNRGCNSIMGRFRVRELTVNGTQVQTLAVDFAQSCDLGGGPALFGNLRLNSAIPVTTPFIETAYDATGSLQFSASGAGIGATAPGGTATIAFTRPLLTAPRNGANGVSMLYFGPLPGQASNGNWKLQFGAANNAVIVPGDYLDIEQYPAPPDGHHSLDFRYGEASAITASGSFHVDTATYESYDGLPQDYHATLVFNRDGYIANQTTGTIDYHAVFRNGGQADEIFPNGFEIGQVAPPSQISLAHPCPLQ